MSPTEARNLTIVSAALALTRDSRIADWHRNSLHVGFHQHPDLDHAFLDVWLGGPKVAAFRIYADDRFEVVSLKVNTISAWLKTMLVFAAPILAKKFGEPASPVRRPADALTVH